MLSRRDVGKLAVGALAMPAIGAKKIDSVVHGVQFGLQSYIFTGIGLPQEGLVEVVIRSMAETGLGECDLYAPLVEPAQFSDRIRGADSAAARAQAREELAWWRATVSLDYFRPIRKKFEDAGIAIYGLSGFPGSTEEELGRTFDIAEVLGARLITLSFGLAAAKRVAPLVEKRGFLVGIQGNPNMSVTNPDAIAKPESYEQAVSLSRNYQISFDIGDATGGGYDALKFVEDHHDRIGLLYLKDRRKDRVSVPYGEGDTHVAEILHLIRDRKYQFRCYLDCDYKTTDRPADVKRSFEFAKAALS
jgi:sugar phosphate isomerase/epimerase